MPYTDAALAAKERYDQAITAYVNAPAHADGSGGTAELAQFYRVLDGLGEHQLSAILDAKMDTRFAPAARKPGPATRIGRAIARCDNFILVLIACTALLLIVVCT